MEQTNAGVQPDQARQPEPAPEMANPAEQAATVQPVQQDPDVMAAAEAIRRMQHSEIDAKAKKVAQVINDLKGQGITVSAEQVIQMMSASAGTAPGKVPAKPAEQAATPIPDGEMEQPGDPVVREAMDMMTEIAGRQLDESDPEFELIDKETDKPSVFLASVKAAAEAYAKRTNNIGNPARIPVLAGGASSHTPNYQNVPGVDILEEWNRTHPL